MVEQRAVNASVAGSNPAGLAIGNWYSGRTRALGARGSGSIPLFPTILLYEYKGGNMTEEKIATVYPELSPEQRLAIREAQFQLTSTRESAQAAVTNAEKAYMAAIEKVATDLKIAPNTAQFNVTTLLFSDK
jgi:hypothetical protein